MSTSTAAHCAMPTDISNSGPADSGIAEPPSSRAGTMRRYRELSTASHHAGVLPPRASSWLDRASNTCTPPRNRQRTPSAVSPATATSDSCARPCLLSVSITCSRGAPDDTSRHNGSSAAGSVLGSGRSMTTQRGPATINQSPGV
ncbi:hypothetical protein MAJHIDBO_00238 [Propionibacterium freudenreichii subsp. shermanii]|nr:hypothetical protein MAJHIDBO_00238 [Propionibacterium freudenreichii subsp. shermanii]SPS08027.1 hypothetical protein MAJHIDBO_00238 [Propionibacterium freudenreichii subsp. shermanii]